MAGTSSGAGKGAKPKRPRTETPPSPDSNVTMKQLMDQQWERISERFTSLEFNLKEDMRQIKLDMKEVKAALNSHENEIDEVRENMATWEQKLTEKEKVLQEEIDRLSAYVARNNFVVLGVKEEEGTNTAQILENFLIKHLKMPADQAKQIKYERLHRANAKMKPRPIKARCVMYEDKVSIQKMSKNLKGTKMFITDDLPKRVRDYRNSQVPVLKAARRAGKLAFFSRSEPGKLFVDHIWLPCEKQQAFIKSLPKEAKKTFLAEHAEGMETDTALEQGDAGGAEAGSGARKGGESSHDTSGAGETQSTSTDSISSRTRHQDRQE